MVCAVKPKTRRALFAERVRRAIKPVLNGWGFENSPKPYAGVYLAFRKDVWIRTREGYSDTIYLAWSQRDPQFSIHVLTTQEERMSQAVERGLHLWVGEIALMAIYLDLWLLDVRLTTFRERPALRDPIALALAKLEEANCYLLTGWRTNPPPPRPQTLRRRML